jgi:hypothetical protein
MHANGFEFFRVKINGKALSSSRRDGSGIISPKDLDRALMNEKNAQTRALVLTLRDSGLRLGDVISLDYELESRDDFYISTLTDKTHTQAQTVLGYDSLNGLREWVRIRRARGHIFNDKTPLFIQERLSLSETRNTTKNIVEYERKISEMRTILTNAAHARAN